MAISLFASILFSEVVWQSFQSSKIELPSIIPGKDDISVRGSQFDQWKRSVDSAMVANPLVVKYQ